MASIIFLTMWFSSVLLLAPSLLSDVRAWKSCGVRGYLCMSSIQFPPHYQRLQTTCNSFYSFLVCVFGLLLHLHHCNPNTHGMVFTCSYYCIHTENIFFPEQWIFIHFPLIYLFLSLSLSLSLSICFVLQEGLSRYADLLTPSLRPALDAILDVTYQMKESEFSENEINEPFAHTFIRDLESRLQPVQANCKKTKTKQKPF